jgi:hypothetical protein
MKLGIYIPFLFLQHKVQAMWHTNEITQASHNLLLRFPGFFAANIIFYSELSLRDTTLSVGSNAKAPQI